MQPRNRFILLEAERFGHREGSNGTAARVRWCRSNGVVDLGMLAKDGPVTLGDPYSSGAAPADREPVTSP